jgi:hypothetical protein
MTFVALAGMFATLIAHIHVMRHGENGRIFVWRMTSNWKQLWNVTGYLLC